MSKPIREVEKLLNVQINYEVFKPASWLRLERKGDVFVSDVRRNHVVLHGSEIS